MKEIKELLKTWREREQEYLKIAEDSRQENIHNYKKFTYQALQLKYCILELERKIDKDF